MKPSALKQNIKARIAAGIMLPIHIESSPGIGKTRIAEQVAKELGIGFIALHAPLLQPEDYGFPIVDRESKDVHFVVSKDKFPIEGSAHPERGILLFDELSQADNNTQKILSNLFEEREIHGHKLKKGWNIISTGNRTTDRAGANRLLTLLANRCNRLELDADIDDFTAWALENNVPTEIVGFLRFRVNLLSAFDANANAFPSPRSWVNGVGKLFGVVPSEQEFETFKGSVGEAAAVEFCAFLKLFRKLPNLDNIIAHPDKMQIPKEPSVQYAIVTGLASRTTKDNMEAIMQYIAKLPKEFSVLYMKDVSARMPDIMETKTFINWMKTHGREMLT